MCNFFSFCTQPSANSDFYYFDWKQRLEMKHEGADSHSHICAYYKIDEDKCNKWEYNPLTRELVLDMQNDPKNDTELVKRWIHKLDWKTIVEPLTIKPIINPFELPPVEAVIDEQIGWLKEWNSVKVADWHWVMASVKEYARESVGTAVGESVWSSLWDSVGDTGSSLVRTSIVASVGASIWDSNWPSLRDSVLVSVWVAVWAYACSFFKTENVLRTAPAIKLWEAGLVPTWDGSVWRLHTGADAHIVYEWKPEEK
jgi:hypothetical protein